MNKRSIKSSYINSLLDEPCVPPLMLRSNRARLIRSCAPKVSLTIEIYGSSKPNILLNVSTSSDVYAFDSLSDVFKFINNNYTISE